MVDIKLLEKVKRLAIIALFSDDELMEQLVLKGGNLLDIVYGVSARASVDVDFSIAADFDLKDLTKRASAALTNTFAEHGFVVFDLSVEEKPDNLTDDMRGFWGGYNIEFKIVQRGIFQKLNGDVKDLRKYAPQIGKRGSPKFSVQISKFEYCEHKSPFQLDGYTIYAYPPVLLVCEKIRAICQQMPEYRQIVRNHPSARARDFVDIHLVAEHFAISIDEPSFRETLKNVFAAKRVPLHFIGAIEEFREFHRQDFPGVVATVKSNVQLKEFDFYFDAVHSYCRRSKILGDV